MNTVLRRGAFIDQIDLVLLCQSSTDGFFSSICFHLVVEEAASIYCIYLQTHFYLHLLHLMSSLKETVWHIYGVTLSGGGMYAICVSMVVDLYISAYYAYKFVKKEFMRLFKWRANWRFI